MPLPHHPALAAMMASLVLTGCGADDARRRRAAFGGLETIEQLHREFHEAKLAGNTARMCALITPAGRAQVALEGARVLGVESTCEEAMAAAVKQLTPEVRANLRRHLDGHGGID